MENYTIFLISMETGNCWRKCFGRALEKKPRNGAFIDALAQYVAEHDGE